jgi:hypothetical protein
MTRIMHSIMHLGKPSDSQVRAICLRCESMKSYSVIWIVFSDRRQEVQDVSGLRTAESIQKKIFAPLCEYLCRSEEPRERAIQIGVKFLS